MKESEQRGRQGHEGSSNWGMHTAESLQERTTPKANRSLSTFSRFNWIVYIVLRFETNRYLKVEKSTYRKRKKESEPGQGPSALALCLENTLFDHPKVICWQFEPKILHKTMTNVHTNRVDSLAMSTLAYSEHIVECTRERARENSLEMRNV